MLELINEISKVKNKEVVIVGSAALLAHGAKINQVKDIDIIVSNIDGLEQLGKIEIFDSISPLSGSGKRAIIKRSDYNIDIFIEQLPDFVEIKDVKYRSLESMELYYKSINPINKVITEFVDSKLNLIKNIKTNG
jgi:hypothetical protein